MQKRFLIAMTMISLCLGGVVSAATWTGDVDTDFLNPYNWTGWVLPPSNLTATIGPSGWGNDPVYSSAASTTSGQVVIIANGKLTVSNGSLNGGPSGDGILIGNGSLTTDGILITGGELSTNGGRGLYVGEELIGGGLGRLTITGGKLTVAGTTTVGYRYDDDEQGGLLNIWGGEVDLGVALRINKATSGTRAASGTIDVRGSGVAKIDLGTRTIDDFKNLVLEGRIVSEPGYGPVVADYNDANVPSVLITAERVYYANSPSPAMNSHIVPQTGQVLSWVNPVPRNLGDVVTSTVYFGTNDPPTTVVPGGSNITGTSVTVNTVAQQTYYWKVDSTDPNGGYPVMTEGNTWKFDTIIPPTVTVGYDGKQAVFRVSDGPADVNAAGVLVATASDDGYPVSPLELTWSAGDFDPNVKFSDPKVLNPTATFDTPGLTYTLTLQAYDGAQTDEATLTVAVYAMGDYCNAAKYPTSFAALTGDMNVDCIVDAKDLAVLVSQWLECNSLDCQ